MSILLQNRSSSKEIKLTPWNMEEVSTIDRWSKSRMFNFSSNYSVPLCSISFFYIWRFWLLYSITSYSVPRIRFFCFLEIIKKLIYVLYIWNRLKKYYVDWFWSPFSKQKRSYANFLIKSWVFINIVYTYKYKFYHFTIFLYKFTGISWFNPIIQRIYCYIRRLLLVYAMNTYIICCYTLFWFNTI